MPKRTNQAELDDDFNDTGTNIKVFQSISKAYYNNNPQKQKRNTLDSLKWFSQYVPRSYNKARTSMVMRDSSTYADSITPGFMYFFVYDPLWKDILPYYDTFPLIFPISSWKKNGIEYFNGINLHLIGPQARYLVMTNLLKIRTEKRYRKSTKLAISWQILKSMSTSKYFEHCIRMYRVDHVRSKFIKIPSQSWEMSAFLPVQRLVGDNAWKI